METPNYEEHILITWGIIRLEREAFTYIWKKLPTNYQPIGTELMYVNDKFWEYVGTSYNAWYNAYTNHSLENNSSIDRWIIYNGNELNSNQDKIMYYENRWWICVGISEFALITYGGCFWTATTQPTSSNTLIFHNDEWCKLEQNVWDTWIHCHIEPSVSDWKIMYIPEEKASFNGVMYKNKHWWVINHSTDLQQLFND